MFLRRCTGIEVGVERCILGIFKGGFGVGAIGWSEVWRRRNLLSVGRTYILYGMRPFFQGKFFVLALLSYIITFDATFSILFLVF